MHEKYQPAKIEPKWQEVWDSKDLFTARRDPKKEKFYYLDMFAYPSGDMHMGHVRNYTIGDVVCRKKTMQGRNVLHPVGFDSFGLPAEQAAIERGLHPADWTKQCIDNMRRQLKMLGVTYDWSRELATSDPSYYKWTQWVFLKLFEAGLAERKKAPVNWCPSCETVLANEQVIQGECERCHAQVTKKNLEQWFFKTTKYAQRNLDDMALLEGRWPPAVLTLERNWIGRSQGTEITFEIVDAPVGVDPEMSVFTTRPDTLFGVTYMVIAPEHPLVARVTKPEHAGHVEEFVERQRLRTEIDRTSEEIEKEGVPTGAMVRNPINGEEVPLWVADYVLLEYGTGIVMAVPGHDQRDGDFARKYGLPIRTVIRPTDAGPDYDVTKDSQAYVDPGVQVNSGRFDGMPSEEGKVAITKALEEMGKGRPTVTYRLRDWCVSRQRYWGAPIPIVYCDKCGAQPVPESELPVLLPTDVTFTGKGGNPIATSPTFVKADCPKCGGHASRETDTMDTFVCSSWYYLRYPCASDTEHAWNSDDIAYWMPIDLYIGGIEHAIGHLLFSRFVTKAFYDMGLLPFREFATRHFNHGVVTWEKKRMSKRGGHLIAPEETIKRHGADALRCYILFIAPAEAPADWTGTGIEGQVRFLSRVHRFCSTYCDRFDPDWKVKIGSESPTERDLVIRRKVHQTVRKISDDIEALKFNTAIAALMELTNHLYAYAPVEGKADGVSAVVLSEALEKMTLILSPFAPHLADEMWEALGKSPTCLETAWPGYDAEIARVEEITIPISVDGKVRDKVVVPADISEADLQEMALARENVQKYLGESGPKRVVVVPGRIVNIVPRK